MKGGRASVRWLAAELVVIVAGILIAVQVEGWRQGHVDRVDEREGLETMLAALEDAAYEDSLFAHSLGERAETVARLIDHLRSPAPHADSVAGLFETAMIRRIYSANSLPWFTALRETGAISLVRDVRLARDLSEFHDGRLPYLQSLVDDLRTFEDRLEVASLPWLSPVPGPARDGEEGRFYRLRANTSVADIAADAEFLSALGWVGRRRQHLAGRMHDTRRINRILQDAIRAHLGAQDGGVA